MRKKQKVLIGLISTAILLTGCLNRPQPEETPRATSAPASEPLATYTATSVPPATVTPTLASRSVSTPTATAIPPATPTDIPPATPTHKPSPSPASTASSSGVGFTERGEPFRGDLDAPVIFEEFSSYQCSFCGKYFSESFSQVIANYVETGQVLYVFRDFPLPSQPQSALAAAAANCAGELGGGSAYWSMHDILFDRQVEWSGRGDAGDIFARYASELELDESKFGQCLDSEAIHARAQADVAEAVARGVRGTPTFLIDGQPLVGAQPYAIIARAIDASLDGETLATEIELAPLSALPPSFVRLPPQVQEAYRFALANPEILEKIPCYCGCNQMGHMNNRMCYIQSVNADGQVILDDHAIT